MKQHGWSMGEAHAFVKVLWLESVVELDAVVTLGCLLTAAISPSPSRLCQKRRRIIKPNDGFRQQLTLYEGMLRAKCV